MSVYHLRVAPGILGDGTFGIYVVPASHPAIEYHLEAQFHDIESARARAQSYREYFGVDWLGSETEIVDKREIIKHPTTDPLNEEQVKSAVGVYYEHLLSPVKQFTIKQPLSITTSTPYLVAYGSLVCFWFSFTFTMPEGFPLLGDWLGGKTFDSPALASVVPYALACTVFYVYVRSRIGAMRYCDAKDKIVALAMRYRWDREKFRSLLLETVSTEGLGWLNKYWEWLATLNQRLPKKNGHSETELDPKVKAVLDSMIVEDFESRVHSLLYLSKEKNFRASTMAFEPISFVLGLRRLRVRADSLSWDSSGAIVPSLMAPPDLVDRTWPRKTIFAISLVNAVAVTAAYAYSYCLGGFPKSTLLAVLVAMGCLASVLVGPIWNYQLLVNQRGRLKGWWMQEFTESKNMMIL